MSEIIKIAAMLARREGMPDDLPEYAFNLLGKLSIDLRNAHDEQQKSISVLAKKADALEHWRQEVGKLHSQTASKEALVVDLVEALHEARTQNSLLQSMRGIVDTGYGTLSIIDAALSKAIPGYTAEEVTK